jgi:hypothetical protein
MNMSMRHTKLACNSEILTCGGFHTPHLAQAQDEAQDKGPEGNHVISEKHVAPAGDFDIAGRPASSHFG